MTHKRYANKVDANQAHIVTTLRGIPGVTVETDHHDIFVGHNKKNYWYEVKNINMRKKDGTWKKGAFRKSQKRLMETWKGHYLPVCTVDEILDDMGIISQYREFMKTCDW
jgi:hypothetical protein